MLVNRRRTYIAVFIAALLSFPLVAAVLKSTLATDAGAKVSDTITDGGKPVPPTSKTPFGAGSVPYEAFHRADPRLPAIPPGAVKHFKIGVYEHVTKVSDDTPPLRVWSFSVNGKYNRGNGVSEPIVVNQGDKVDVEFTNGVSKAMGVTRGHSIDFHSAAVAPTKDFKTLVPGGSTHFSFTAKYPGVFLYHCATQPMVQHLGSGMVGMMIVKPRTLAHVDQEYWLMQQEYYPAAPGQDPAMAGIVAKEPNVVAFNGYANQYRTHPIKTEVGKKIRVYLLDAGPALPLDFHVIGTVFDTTHIEGVTGHDAQAVAMQPAQGGWVDFSLAEKGGYPFVTHAFADMMKGADGAFTTKGVPASAVAGF